jgi:hypothetical protein
MSATVCRISDAALVATDAGSRALAVLNAAREFVRISTGQNTSGGGHLSHQAELRKALVDAVRRLDED